MSVQSSLARTPFIPMALRASAQVLAQWASGQWVGCFGLTEPNSGPTSARMSTRAEKVDGGYRVTGAKMWITNSPSLTFLWSGAS